MGEEIDFCYLLKKLDALEGDFKLRFMTSHPKDATKELFDVIAGSKHISKHIHLPVQCGSNRVLKEMNRKYTKEDYLKKIEYAKSIMKDVSFTSDIIVGFPGETYEEFLETVDLIKKVEFSSLMLSKGSVLNRDQLMEKVWDVEFSGDARTVDVHIRYLRQKIEDDSENPKYILTVRGVGYRFASEDEIQ